MSLPQHSLPMCSGSPGEPLPGCQVCRGLQKLPVAWRTVLGAAPGMRGAALSCEGGQRPESSPKRWRMSVLLLRHQRPKLTSECRRQTQQHQQTPSPSWRISEGRPRTCSPGEGGRKNRKRLAFKGAIGRQSVFPSPAESKAFCLLREWLTLFSWCEGCCQEPPQSSSKLLP